MKHDAIIAGIGMTQFGKHLDRSLSDLSQEAIRQAITDAGVSADDIQAAWAGNAAGGLITGQVCIAGQTALRGMGIGHIPVVNVENACATASTAFQQACTMVTFGLYDVVLAFGVEKLHHEERSRIQQVFEGCTDIEAVDQLRDYLVEDGDEDAAAAQGGRQSIFIDIYARIARDYMKQSGATVRDFAAVSAKNSRHGALNPLAQYRDVMSVEDVLAARMVSDPLTLPMCSPIGDGAAAAIVVSPKAAARLGIRKPVRVRSSVLASGCDRSEGEASFTEVTSKAAYEAAGIGADEVHCVELHDAAASAELTQYETLGLCGPGEGPALLASGATTLGGRVPVNTSGGLMRKGHPVGATGLAQIAELTRQLRGEAGARQVEGAQVGLAANGGGFLRGDTAAMVITLLSR